MGDSCCSRWLSLLCLEEVWILRELLLGSLGFLDFLLPSLVKSNVDLEGVMTVLDVLDCLPKSNFLFLAEAQVVLETGWG